MNRLTQKPVHSGESALQWQRFKPFQKLRLSDLLTADFLAIAQMDGLGTSKKFAVGLFSITDTKRFFSKEDILPIREHLKVLKINCKGFGLKESAKLLLELDTFFEKNIADDVPINCVQFNTILQEIDRRVGHEMENIIFGFVPMDRTEYLSQKHLFGKAVFKQFPSARLEIAEAGNCYAHGLHSACVFHLMRVVEIGAKAMVRDLKAERHIYEMVPGKGVKKPVRKPIELCDWNRLKDGLMKSLAALEKGTKTNTEKKDKLEYFSHVISQFNLFRNAWRNKVAHSRKIYQGGETKDIMDNVRQFMQELARKVKE